MTAFADSSGVVELYAGKANKIVAHLQRRLDETPKTGPGNKGKRERLSGVIRYLRKRLSQIRLRPPDRRGP